MLLYTRRAPPKTAKRRSRAGCVHCKDKKKKCTEERPSCQRCVERGLDCHYEPIQARKRWRTASPVDHSDPSSSAMRSASTSSSPSIGHRSRIQPLRQENSTGPQPLMPSTSPPSLGPMAGAWDTQSAFDDSASQYISDFTSDASLSPDLLAEFPGASGRHSSVPVESMEMLMNDYSDHRSRSHLGTPDFVATDFRRSSHTSSPNVMSVPFRRPSDSGVAEVVASIPIMPPTRIESADMITSIPLPPSGSFHEPPHHLMLSPSHPFEMHNDDTSHIMQSFPEMQSHHLGTPEFIPSSLATSNASFYPTSDAFIGTTENPTPTAPGLYPSTNAHVHPATTSQSNVDSMAWWQPSDHMGSNY